MIKYIAVTFQLDSKVKNIFLCSYVRLTQNIILYLKYNYKQQHEIKVFTILLFKNNQKVTT